MKQKLHILFILLILTVPFIANGEGWIKRITNNSYTILNPVFAELDNDTTFAIGGTTNSNSKLFLGKFTKSQSSASGHTFDKSGSYEEIYCLLPSRFRHEYWGLGHVSSYQTTIYKADSTGRILYCKRYAVGNGGFSENQSLRELPNGDVILSTRQSVLRIDSTCNLIWSKCLPDMQIHNCGMVALSDSRFLIAGEIENGLAWNSGTDFFLQCFDTSGNVLWTKTYGNDGNDYATAVTLSANGRIYIGGYHWSGIYTRESVLACFDTSGNLLWNKLYPYTDGIYDVKAVDSNRLAMLSETNSSVPSDSTVRYSILDAQGNLLQSQLVTGGGNFIETADSSVCFSIGTFFGKYLVRLDGFRFPQCLNPVADWFDWRTEDWQTVVHPVFPFTTTGLNVLTGADLTSSLTLYNFCQSTCTVRAQFVPSDIQPCMNATVNFTNESNGAVQYTWRVDNDSVSSATNFSKAFTSPGNHRVTLVVKNGACVDSMAMVLHVNGTPVSTFQVSKTNKVIDCIADSGGHDKYLWNFSDGTSYYGTDTAQHSYAQSGTYTICLTAYNSCGNSMSCQQVFPGPLATNTFQRIIQQSDTHRPNNIVELADGGFYCTSRSDFTSDEPHLFKLAADGSPVRNMEIGGAPSGLGWGQYEFDRVSLSSDGSLYYAGWNEGAKIFYGRIDDEWYPWNHSFDASSSNCMLGGIAEFKNQNFIFGLGRFGIGLLMMHNRWGDTLWVRQYFGIQGIRGLEIDGDSNVVALGVHSAYNGMALFKVNHAGNVLWAYDYSDTASTSNVGHQLLKTRDGKYLVAGSNGGKGILLKVDTSGAVIWSRKYSVNLVSQVTELLDGSLYFISGKQVCHTDALGNVLSAWSDSNAWGFSTLTGTSDTGVVVAGNLNATFPNDEEYEIIKFNRNGFATCGVAPAIVTQLPSAYTRSTHSIFTQYLGNPLVILTNWLAATQPIDDTLLCYASAAVAHFSGDTVCARLPLQFVNQSTGSIASYSWQFGSGIPATSNLANPLVTWNSPGQQLVSLTITDSSGNQSVYSRHVAILPIPYVYSNNKNLCDSGQVILNASGSGFQTITWSPATGLTSTTGTSVGASPSQTTVYTITATSSLGCVKDTTVTVTHVPKPVVSFLPDDTVCVNQTNIFIPTGASTYAWYVNNSFIGNTTGNFSYYVAGPGFNLRVIGMDSLFCRDTMSVSFIVDSCIPTGLPTPEMTAFVRIYPSPAQDNLYIDNLELFADSKFTLYDLTGRAVIRLEKATSPVNISSLSPGIYIVELKGREGLWMNSKMIKQ